MPISCYSITPHAIAFNSERDVRLLQAMSHAATCSAKSSCAVSDACNLGKMVLAHVICCDSSKCCDKECYRAKTLLKHFIACTDLHCEMCMACVSSGDNQPATFSKVDVGVDMDARTKLVVLLLAGLLKRGAVEQGSNTWRSKQHLVHLVDCGDHNCPRPGCASSRAVLQRSLQCACAEQEACQTCHVVRSFFRRARN